MRLTAHATSTCQLRNSPTRRRLRAGKKPAADVAAPVLLPVLVLPVLVLDALQYKKHPTHLTIDEALSVVSELRPRETWFTTANWADWMGGLAACGGGFLLPVGWLGLRNG